MDTTEFIPEPFRAMIQQINPGDLYLIQELEDDTPIRIRKISKEAFAEQLDSAERGLKTPNTTVRRVRGGHLRTLLLELARAHGHIIGYGVQVDR